MSQRVLALAGARRRTREHVQTNTMRLQSDMFYTPMIVSTIVSIIVFPVERYFVCVLPRESHMVHARVHSRVK